jgi:hypothetical protein
MADFSLKFEMDNAAFRYEDGSLYMQEAARVVQNVVTRIRAGHMHGAVIDTNGNTIGDWSVTLDADEEVSHG